MRYLGLDIGTTTICGVILDENFNVLKAITRANLSEIKSDNTFERIQDADITFDIVKKIADELLAEYDEIVSIGVSGQMHGILYYDENGKAISPLYYWQDKRGLETYKDNKTYLDELNQLTKSKLSSGYGCVSHFYNLKNNLVPNNTVGLCTIGDYVSMRLSNNNKVLMHTSQAASLGLFDLKNLCFDKDKLNKAGFNLELFPETCTTNKVVGQYKGIDVYVSLGDNQASFYGSKVYDDGILINVGTGSQISLMTKYTDTNQGIELRPLNNDLYILVGAAICGGKSYSILKNFFEECATLFKVKIDDMYSLMNDCANINSDLKVDTRFLGTRVDPSIRGKIENIDDKNFTPSNLVSGFNKGMALELFNLYELMNKPLKTRLIGSGNGCRMNNNFVKEVEKIFNMKLELSSLKEEAASGAAIFTRE